jgi:MinD-like ATPase involved in chromosome partitioning or flagellar assembly
VSGRRYVVLGLAHPRSDWFRSLAQWCNGGALPAEFVKCVSASEVVQRLDDGRTFSALIVDAGLSGVDRDLLTAAALAHCAVIVVDDPRVARDWSSLGASTVLSNDFSRAELLDTLATHAAMVDRATESRPDDGDDANSLVPGANVIAVVGPGGTGTSTVAIGLAQGMVAEGHRTVLADLRLHAEQAMLHDATDSAGGLQSLVDALRAGDLSNDRVPEFALHVPNRGYDLIPGLRRARFWSSIRPVAFTAAFATIGRAYDTVVCDTEADVETEETGGSLDVEERSIMSRVALNEANAVVVVAHPSMKGLHSVNRLMIDLGDLGVDAEKILCVFNHAPKSPRTRAGYVAALSELIDWRGGTHPKLDALHLPTREIDEALRAGDPLPSAMSSVLAAAVSPLLATTPLAPVNTTAFARIRPGSFRRTHESKAS